MHHPPLAMSSQPFDSLEITAQVPTWVLVATLGVLAITWATATLAIDATVDTAEPAASRPFVLRMQE